MMTIQNENQAIEIGGKLWEKGSMKRVYFTEEGTYKVLGITFEKEKVCGVEKVKEVYQNGVKISKNDLKKMMMYKYFYDCNTQKVVKG